MNCRECKGELICSKMCDYTLERYINFFIEKVDAVKSLFKNEICCPTCLLKWSVRTIFPLYPIFLSFDDAYAEVRFANRYKLIIDLNGLIVISCNETI